MMTQRSAPRGSRLLAERFAFDDVVEANPAADFGEDRDHVRIPLAQHGARLDLLAVLDEQDGTVRERRSSRAIAVLGPEDDAFRRCASRATLLALDRW